MKNVLAKIVEEISLDDFVNWKTSIKPKKLVDSGIIVPAKDRFVIELLKPNMEKGPWIAGGAALAWYLNRPVGLSDIDIFCKDVEQEVEVRHKITNNGGNLTYDSKSAKTYEIRDIETGNKEHTLQVITMKHFESMQDVLNSFDISVCRVGTDGYHYMLGDGTAYDINHKILRMRTPFAPDSVKRLIKYWCYGYTPTDELLEALQMDPDIKWDFTGQEGDYLNAF